MRKCRDLRFSLASFRYRDCWGKVLKIGAIFGELRFERLREYVQIFLEIILLAVGTPNAEGASFFLLR